MAEAAPYPVTFEAVYPDRLSRLSTFFRLLLFVPIGVFGAVLLGSQLGRDEATGRTFAFALGTAGSVAVASWLAILVRGRIPRWLFDFQVALTRWVNRAFGYLFLLTDRYPPFEGDWVISYDVRYPERLTRWKLLFWKVITAIPHFIILLFLGLGAIVVTIIAWFFILVAGRYPRGLFEYVAGVMRWSARVQAYVLLPDGRIPALQPLGRGGPGRRRRLSHLDHPGLPPGGRRHRRGRGVHSRRGRGAGSAGELPEPAGGRVVWHGPDRRCDGGPDFGFRPIVGGRDAAGGRQRQAPGHVRVLGGERERAGTSRSRSRTSSSGTRRARSTSPSWWWWPVIRRRRT